MRASSGLHRHNRQLRRLFYLSFRAPLSTFLEWVRGDLKPTDCFSRIDSDFGGSHAMVAASAWNRFQALLTFSGLPCPVWILSFLTPGCFTQSAISPSWCREGGVFQE